MASRIRGTFGILARDWKMWVGLALLAAGAFGLAACSTPSFEMKVGQSELKPSFLTSAAEVVKTVGGITGLPWLDTIGSILLAVGGGGLLGKRAVNAYAKAEYTPEEKAEIAAIAKTEAPKV